jgi:hypothetical protein
MRSRKISAVIFTVFTVFMLALTVMPVTVSARSGPDMKVAASSWDRSEGRPENAIDGDDYTFWHSLWDVQAAIDSGYENAQSAHNIFPQVLIVEFDGVYMLDCIGYLARNYSASRNGTVIQYEFWASETGTIEDLHNDSGWIMIAEGMWDENDAEFIYGDFKRVDFDQVRARAVKLKVLYGVGGWASCAELQFGFTDVEYVPMFGFTPRTTPLGMSAEEFPAAGIDGGGAAEAVEANDDDDDGEIYEGPLDEAAGLNNTVIMIIAAAAAGIVAAVVLTAIAKVNAK